MTVIQFILIMVPIVLLLNFLAYYVFIPRDNRKIYDDLDQGGKYAYYIFSKIFPYLLIICAVYLFVKSQGMIVEYFNIVPYYGLAEYIFLIEGDIVGNFQAIMLPGITYFSMFIYLIGFPFILIFTFIVFFSTLKIEQLQEYAIGIIIIYMVAFPFYIFMPVKVTGYSLSGVFPLLYELHPVIDSGLRSVDPYLDNCFPSLHAALSILAMLLIVFRTDLKALKVMSFVLVLLIQFTIFYLGIHWISDFIAGTALAFLAYFISTRYRSKIIDSCSYILKSGDAMWKK